MRTSQIAPLAAVLLGAGVPPAAAAATLGISRRTLRALSRRPEVYAEAAAILALRTDYAAREWYRKACAFLTYASLDEALCFMDNLSRQARHWGNENEPERTARPEQ